MLYVILLSVQMILLSTLSVIRHQASELESDLRDIVDWAGSGLLISILEKLSGFF